MQDYDWENSSTVMYTGDDQTREIDPTRQIYNDYVNGINHQQCYNNDSLLQNQTGSFSNHDLFNEQVHHHSFYDPRPYDGASTYNQTHHQTHHQTMLPLDHSLSNGGGYLIVPKNEEITRPFDISSRIGLNLGGRTYFSAADDDFVNRLYRRTGPGETGHVNTPKCQAEGCTADLTHAKHYHRRHKVCEYHSKSSTVVAAGLTQRFCQQCSRFHMLSEFDNGKRSCRKRLADHNRRRRKNHIPINEPNKSNTESSRNSADNTSSSSKDSGAPRSKMWLDCFRQTSFDGTATSSSSISLFYSGG